jgi:hypothetical protein
MSRLRCHIAISLDGFVAGPNQSDANPLGVGRGPAVLPELTERSGRLYGLHRTYACFGV